jgi:anti-sigma regulatory factor (Ser/Thr protein kinase)
MAARNPMELSERTFAGETSSIGHARRFVRDATAGVGDSIVRADLAGDLELAVSELVTNAVQYGLAGPVTVRVNVTDAAIEVSVRSARTSSRITDPSTWAGPLPAMRTGRGLAIVRAISDDVSVDADDDNVTVRCTFGLR